MRELGIRWRVRSTVLDHPCIHEDLTELLGHRHAMVTIDHEVLAALRTAGRTGFSLQLPKVKRWQGSASLHGRADAMEALGYCLASSIEEVAAQIPPTTHA